MLKRIPKRFRLGAHTWTVHQISQKEMNDKHGPKEDLYGITYPDELTIYLRKAGAGFKKEVVMETFMHELTHALLWTAGHKHWKDERVVTTVSHLMLSYTPEFK